MAKRKGKRRIVKSSLPTRKEGVSKGPIKITIYDYNEEMFEEREIKAAKECLEYKGRPTITWVNVDGVEDHEAVEAICKCFGIHPLTVEDVLHIGQRPKVDDYGQYLYIVVKMIYQFGESKEIVAEQVSIILGMTWVLSFQERIGGDVFDPVRDRLRKGKGLTRKKKADFLVYALIDAIVDNYFLILEDFGNKLENLDEELVTNPTEETMHTIHNLMRDLIFLQKTLWPLRSVVEHMGKGTARFDQETSLYIKDLTDHTVQVLDTIDTFMALLSSMMDTYVSSLSHKMTDVLKVLTIITTIFTPATFIASVYGMNFQVNMPEIHHPAGYALSWVAMGGSILMMLYFFKRKKWW